MEIESTTNQDISTNDIMVTEADVSTSDVMAVENTTLPTPASATKPQKKTPGIITIISLFYTQLH